ncbi:beta family protein [Sphingopyxis sp. R3-92]|uniref:beta family protein n=1 Tax=Sphingopyxis sp. R3-92 TaxID=3158553 RepID=UPI003EE6B516
MLAGKTYVPILKTGIVEIAAYRNLYDSVKQVTLPFFRLRPWPRANHLWDSIQQIIDATSGGPFILGLDHSRHNHVNPRPAQSEFNDLFDPEGGFSAYYEFLGGIDGATPVILPTVDASNIADQIANAEALGRGLVVHQRREGDPNLITLFLEAHPHPTDCVFVLDGEWARSYVTLESWCLPLVAALSPSLSHSELVIACSSFPDNFSHIIGNKEEIANERRLFDVVRQQFNQLDLTYGDWGSTRHSSYGGGNYIPSRVDLPKLGSWEIFRADPKNDLGFAEMAWNAQHHSCFPDTIDCWGKEMIAITDDTGLGVKSRWESIKVRINIHMTIQSGSESVLPTNEIPYTD